MMTWNQLKTLPVGTRVSFPNGMDIYPHCIVPHGTRGTIVSNELATNGILDILPDHEPTRAALSEWDGQIQLFPYNGGESYDSESPVALLDKYQRAETLAREIAQHGSITDLVCGLLQREIGVTDGGVASQVFSGVQDSDWCDMSPAQRESFLINYLKTEKAYDSQ